jgi:hypothetical protein
MESAITDKELESDRKAAARAAGTAFTKGNLTESEFLGVLKDMKITGESANLWLFRYKIAKKQQFSAADIANMEAGA